MSRRPAGGRTGAFTLIEVLVAALLTAILATTLAAMIGALLRNWNRAQGQLIAAGQAHRIFDQLERDLQQARRPIDGGVALAATIQTSTGSSGLWIPGTKPEPSSLLLNAVELNDCRFGVGGIWLRLLTNRSGTDPRSGDLAAPAAISYQIIRRPLTTGSFESRYLFYRADVTSAATHAAGFNLSSVAYGVASDVGGDVGNLVSPPARYVLAENVVDFGVRFYAANGNDLALIYPVDAAQLEHHARHSQGSAGERMPTVIDVMIRILTDDGSQRIAALENSRVQGDWWDIALAHSHVFTRRIAVVADQP